MAITTRYLGMPPVGSDSLYAEGQEAVHKVTDLVYPIEIRISLDVLREQTVEWWNGKIQAYVDILASDLEDEATA